MAGTEWREGKSPGGAPTLERLAAPGLTLAVMETRGGYKAAARLVTSAPTLDEAKAAAERIAEKMLAETAPAPDIVAAVSESAAAAAKAAGWERKRPGSNKRWGLDAGRLRGHISCIKGGGGWVYHWEVDGVGVEHSKPHRSFTAALDAATAAAADGADALLERRAAEKAQKAAAAG